MLLMLKEAILPKEAFLFIKKVTVQEIGETVLTIKASVCARGW
jgi:hypothetical protein